jgi:hypothetical protein
LDIITIALCAVLCGADSWVEVETFGTAKRAWLGTFLALPNGIPSHDTFRRVFAALDPTAFERCFLGWIQAVARTTVGEQIAIDGKTLRRSHDRANGQGPLHLVSAWATQQRRRELRSAAPHRPQFAAPGTDRQARPQGQTPQGRMGRRLPSHGLGRPILRLPWAFSWS